MIICASPGDAVWKCSWMMFRAGATAAPAITVRSDKDNIAVINLQRLCFLNMLYMSVSILLKKKSASPFGLTLSQLNAVRLPQKTEKNQWLFLQKDMQFIVKTAYPCFVLDKGVATAEGLVL